VALPFLDRTQELARLNGALARAHGSLVCIWGRRRLGKSRLLQESLRDRGAVYFVGDERDAALQRSALAREMSAVVAGMADVTYSDWDPLLARWWREAPRGAVLALDEFPDLVRQSPELPSVLQKYVDRRSELARHVVLCGSARISSLARP
jgi:uncharacterized protein